MVIGGFLDRLGLGFLLVAIVRAGSVPATRRLQVVLAGGIGAHRESRKQLFQVRAAACGASYDRRFEDEELKLV